MAPLWGDDIVRTPGKLGGAILKLYEIRNTINTTVYVGITRSSIKQRWSSHKWAAKVGISPLYLAMRKHGIENFSIHLIAEFGEESKLQLAERTRIQQQRAQTSCYNVLDGGESYFPIKDKVAWKEKLRAARVGRKPALGMTHSEENKKVFSECGKVRWDKYGRYPANTMTLAFKEAKTAYGISKTHYYRLKKAGKK